MTILRQMGSTAALVKHGFPGVASSPLTPFVKDKPETPRYGRARHAHPPDRLVAKLR
jgi:hypothetical protein